MKFLLPFLCLVSLCVVSHAEPLLVKSRVWAPNTTDGAPVVNAQILVRSLDPSSGSLIEEKVLSTDAHGLFETQVEVSSDRRATRWPLAYVLVRASGQSMACETFRGTGKVAFSDDHVITLKSASELLGCVNDKDNQVASQATISALGVDTGRFYIPLNDEKRGISTPWLQVRTNASGNFSFPSLDLTEFKDEDFSTPLDLLATTTRANRVWKGRNRSFFQGPDGARLKIVVEPTYAVSGIVTNFVTHLPVANIKISLSGSSYPELDSMAPVSTDANGKWHIENVPQTRVLIAHVQGEGFGDFIQVVDPQNDAPSQAEIRPLVSISGTVLDTGGNALRTPFTIIWVPEETNIWAPAQVITASVESDGRFSLRVPVGEQKFRVRGRGYRETGLHRDRYSCRWDYRFEVADQAREKLVVPRNVPQ